MCQNNRIEKLRKVLQANYCDAMLISKEENLHYFSGFTGDDTFLVITLDNCFLITDSRYTKQASEQTSFTIIEQKTGLLSKTVELIKKLNINSLAFEGNALIFNQYNYLAKNLIDIEVDFSTSLDLTELRIIKDENEIELIKKAINISDEAYSHILKFVKAGMSEQEVATELEYFMRKLGSERPAFTTIVASGVRGALPHGVATDKLINNGEFVTIDFGAVYKGYHSDITRTFCVGKASDRQKEIYDIVLQAQLLGLKEIAPNKSGREVDFPVREYIKNAGYGDFFGHGLGHGVGLEIHELPRLSPLSSTDKLKENMIVTNEPGIYVPDFGGVRIEDTVLVTANGCQALTQSDKRLVEIM
ncbi:aminopeptidase P family protein [Megamonas rupellensis]|jgi:Xaa-Pro aminopeptidase|uniref:Aminopeptidase P family protein n=1 Tax=Megamonas rupellensis TaxID=491921 RepID=A0A412CFD3_9FIRM|nr:MULTISPECIES: aminopeptidase P family protein [Megamonas]RGQ84613.1 aminopeptidase P family protein [Megamonas rupellensis]